MSSEWTSERLLQCARDYQQTAVILAAAELGVVEVLRDGPRSGAELARAIRGDERATSILADALAALGILTKVDGAYSASPGLADLFSEGSPGNLVPMLRHQANCLRSWSHLAAVVRSGRPHEREPSVNGPEDDRRSFIEAMAVASREIAAEVVGGLGALEFEHLLDVGGGPGTWTAAFLSANPKGRATLYDRAEVIPIARKHLGAAGLIERVTLVAGDYTTDESLPSGVDLVWISAVAHQNSAAQNRDLYAKAFQALRSGGQLLIRDIVMDESRTSPPAGAMFAVNMLVNTEGGRTYSLDETSTELHGIGFGGLDRVPGPREMDTVLRVFKP